MEGSTPVKRYFVPGGGVTHPWAQDGSTPLKINVPVAKTESLPQTSSTTLTSDTMDFTFL